MVKDKYIQRAEKLMKKTNELLDVLRKIPEEEREIDFIGLIHYLSKQLNQTIKELEERINYTIDKEKKASKDGKQ